MFGFSVPLQCLIDLVIETMNNAMVKIDTLYLALRFNLF